MNTIKYVWYVLGEDYALFDTKIAAEAYAREVYPDEGEHKRYARIFSRGVYSLEDVQGNISTGFNCPKCGKSSLHF